MRESNSICIFDVMSGPQLSTSLLAEFIERKPSDLISIIWKVISGQSTSSRTDQVLSRKSTSKQQQQKRCGKK